MKEKDTRDGSDPVNRRSVLQKLGATTGVLATAPFVGSVTADDDSSENGTFAMSGTEHVRVQYEPDEITTHWKKTSPELQERYGRAALETTETMERPEPEKDSYPLRGTVTDNRPWETRLATEDEWTREFKRAETDGEVGALTHNETDYSYGVWTYKENDNGYYEQGSPINLISPDSISDVLDSLYTWACSWQTGWVAEHDRYAYNTDSYSFEVQHDSAASSTFGSVGRDHIRMWEFGGYTSIQAHVDSSAPHEATSYLDAERTVTDCLDSADWYTYDDFYDLPNCCPLDHNGAATRVSD